MRQFRTKHDRRTFLQRASALAAIGVSTTLTPDLAFGQAGTDLKGVSIDYWNMIGVQNKTIRQISEDIIAAFEQRTGATVNVTWNGYGDIIGPKYRTNFVGGIRPTVFDTSARWANQLREFLYPLNDFIASGLDPEAREGMTWMIPLMEEQNRGFSDPDQNYALPFNILSQACYLLRRDHLEAAGLSFEENYPIRDGAHYIEICETIKAKAGIQYPTEVYGKIWDFGDTQLPGWVRSVGIENSDFLNADWTASTATSDNWMRACQFYVDIFRKYGLSSPNTPQSTDEEAVDQFILGRKSVVHCDLLNRGTLLERIPDEIADGTVVWGANFPVAGGQSGSNGFTDSNAFYIVADEGPDAEIKRIAAQEFINEWAKAENMLAVAKALGLCSRRDLWAQLEGEPDNFAEAAVQTVGEDPGIWSAHPKSVDFQYNLLAPHGQRMLQGEPVEQELQAYAAEVNEALKV